MNKNHSPTNGARHPSAITTTAIRSTPDCSFELTSDCLSQLHHFARNRLKLLRKRRERHVFPEGEAEDLVAEVLLAAIKGQRRGDLELMALSSPEAYLNYLYEKIEKRSQALARRRESRHPHVSVESAGAELDRTLRTGPLEL